MRRSLLCTALTLISAALPAQTTLVVGAGTAVAGLFDPIKAHLEKERNIKLVYKEESGTEQFADVETGAVDICVSGITMEGWIDAIKAKGKPVRPAYDYRHMQVGVDQLSVLVNPDVVTDVAVLTMDLDKAQLKGLFTGQYKNWKELGGPDLPVQVLVSHLFAATTKVFCDVVLDGQPLVANHRVLKGGMYDIAKELVATKGAITFGPYALTSNSKIWSPAQAPKIERPYTMIVTSKLDPAKEKAVAGMVEFILGPGAKYIPKAAN
jgi:phosphate transport system substrate-binding protein